MKAKYIITNKKLTMQSGDESPLTLPWDLETILDLGLSKDDIETLESDVMLQIGEMYLTLVEDK